jgi:hypothetical protein
MGENDDKNSKKKKLKKTIKTGTTQIQIANKDLEILRDSEQAWRLTNKKIHKKNKETKGKGYHTEGEMPQKKRKKRSTSDNENNPMDIATDIAMHGAETHLIELSPTGTHPPQTTSQHQRQKLDIDSDEPTTSYNASRVNPTQPRMQLRSHTSAPAQIQTLSEGRPESQHKANIDKTVTTMQTMSYKCQLEEDEPVSDEAFNTSSDEDTGNEKPNHPKKNIMLHLMKSR